MAPTPSPLDRLVTLPTGTPDLTLGWEVVRAAVKYLRQPNGPRAGQRWEWIDSQIRFLLWWYAVDADGRWLFHHGARRLAKGSGKSPFAALLAIAELCFPVRLKDFDPTVPGGCIGKPVAMPLVQICATAESQTANTMRMVRAFAPKGSRIVSEFGLDPGKVKYYKAPEGTLEVITSSDAAAEGAESTMVVADETEHWTPSRGGPTLAATLSDNLAKSGSRMLETANAWEPGLNSVAEDTYDAWVAQEEGRTRGQSRILYDARISPPDTDMSDPESLRAALDFVYDDAWWVDRRPIMERIWDARSRPDDSKRKYLNRPTAAADAWVEAEAWEQCADPSIVVGSNDDIALFFDGSRTSDATALIGCRIDDGHVFTLGVWEPTERLDGVVPVSEVDFTVRAAFDKYRVRGFFGDVKEWEQYTTVSWPDDYADDLDIWAVAGGRTPHAIAWDMRNGAHTRDFAEAAEFTEAEINNGGFTHDGDSRVARHIANARRRVHKGYVSIGKETRHSPRKIDAAVCVIGARMVRRLVMASPAWQAGDQTNEAVFF